MATDDIALPDGADGRPLVSVSPPAPADATRLGRADLHLHTNLGDGTASPARVLGEARRRELDVIAVTDHDHMEGAKRLADLLANESPDVSAAQPIEMIWGCEITTRQGHFIGLFLREPVKMLRHVEESIDAVKAQGGLCVVPHPLGRLVPSLSRRKIDELLDRGSTRGRAPPCAS